MTAAVTVNFIDYLAYNYGSNTFHSIIEHCFIEQSSHLYIDYLIKTDIVL